MDGKLYIKLLKIINGIQDDSTIWSWVSHHSLKQKYYSVDMAVFLLSAFTRNHVLENSTIQLHVLRKIVVKVTKKYSFTRSLTMASE